MDAVFRFLGVAPRPTTSDFVKTSRNNWSNKIENYKEVRQALRGTTAGGDADIWMRVEQVHEPV